MYLKIKPLKNMETKKLSVPDGWHEVTIEQFQEIAILTNDGVEKTFDVLSILLDEDPELIKKFDVETYSTLIEMLTWTNELPNDAEYKPIIRFDDKEFGIISRMNSLTVGEWIDLEHYLEQPIANMHFIMSILYRPLITAFNDRDRLIEEYDADKMLEQAIEFKTNVKVGDVYGALVFFYLIANESTKIIQDYLVEAQTSIMTKS